MGVKGLTAFIKKNSEIAAMREYTLQKFRNQYWIVAVDASLMIYQTVTAIRSGNRGEDLTNSRGERTSHLLGIAQKCATFLEYSVRPVFVFDGEACDRKDNTLDDREKKRAIAEEQLSCTEQGSPKYCQLRNQTYRVSKKDIQSTQQMLDLLGIPWIQAPAEADEVCVWLTQQRKDGIRWMKGVVSNDLDMLPLGCKYLFKNMSAFLDKKRGAQESKIQILSLPRTLRGLGLTYPQFIDTCVMLGTDYARNIPGVGPVKTLELIRKHGSLKSVLRAFPDLPEDHRERLQDARDYFRNATAALTDNPEFQVTWDSIQQRTMCYPELLDYLSAKHGFEIWRVTTLLNRIQSSLDAMKEQVFLGRNKADRSYRAASPDGVLLAPLEEL